MPEALISRLARDEARAPASAEVPPHASAIISSFHCELEKVKFPKFFGAPDGAVVEAWMENMAMCFALRNYTSNMRVRVAVFQWKGSALLWWKTLPPQLSMVVEDMSWELFEGRFRERYLPEEFMEHQLNEFNALRQGGRTMLEHEARLWRYSGKLRALTLRSLRLSGSCSTLTTVCVQGLNVLTPQTLHDAVQKTVVQDEFRFLGKASEAEQKVGGRATGCALNLGKFVMRVSLYVTISGSYDVVIGMDRLETQEAILNVRRNG
jgi:hypothetical protein